MDMEEKRIPLLESMGYPELAVKFIVNKTNVGELPSPTVSAKNQGTCGDIMILHLKIEQDIITDAKYDYIGCAGLQAAASALTEMIIGMKLKNAKNIESRDILFYLGGLPEQKHECALLASNTLKKALEAFYND
jgi:nitrogen fixation NifU-like protein